MRFLIIFILAYITFRTVKNLLSKVKIVERDNVNLNNHTNDPSARLKVDESDIEDADFKEVD